MNAIPIGPRPKPVDQDKPNPPRDEDKPNPPRDEDKPNK